jgi:ribonuclease I
MQRPHTRTVWLAVVLHLVYMCHAIIDYDLLILSQLWPSSINNYPTTMNNIFLIHGLWAAFNNGTILQFCNGTFNVNLVDAVQLTAIENLWMNAKNPQSTDAVAVQYNQFGTCTLNKSNNITSQNDYIWKALRLRMGQDLFGMLAASGILPGDEAVETSNVNAAIQLGSTVTPVLLCSSNGGESYLSEVWQCFSPNFVLRDCPQTLQSSCQGNIIFSSNAPILTQSSIVLISVVAVLAVLLGITLVAFAATVAYLWRRFSRIGKDLREEDRNYDKMLEQK